MSCQFFREGCHHPQTDGPYCLWPESCPILAGKTPLNVMVRQMDSYGWSGWSLREIMPWSRFMATWYAIGPDDIAKIIRGEIVQLTDLAFVAMKEPER